MKTVAAIVVNNRNEILTYTCRGSKQSCEEYMIESYGEDVWKRLQEIGCSIRECEISIGE